MAEPTKNPVRSGTNNAVFVVFGVIAIAALAVVMIIYKPNFPGLNFKGNTELSSGYVLLFKNMELTDAANVVESLKAQGVKDFKIEDDGRTILIPRKKRNDVVLSIAKEGILPSGGTVGFEIFDKGAALGATDFDKQIKFSRAISGELARSISRVYGVEECRVQVVIPAKQLFSTVKNPVQTAVFVKVREGELLSPLQVFGIVSLVASSVEDLRTANVTVVDYYGRVLSAPEYAKDYERLQALLFTQKEEARKTAGVKMNSLTTADDGQLTAQPTKAGKPGKSFFEMYRKTDVNEMTRLLTAKGKGTATEILEAKLKFKDKYEKVLEKNIREILIQFFPKNSFLVKINIEVSNLMTAESTLETLIARITTLILLDENNSNVRITPENKEVIIKAVASSIGYVRGRDRIELRLSPLTVEKSTLGQIQEQLKEQPKKKKTEEKNTTIVEMTGKKIKPLGLNLTRFKPKDITIDWTFLYYGGGALAVLVLFMLIFKRKKPVLAEQAEDTKSIFDEKDKSGAEGFDDVTAVPSVDQMRDLVSQSPEKVAAVLEQWLKED